jgi:hypothetical protein
MNCTGCGLCGLALPSIIIGQLANGWPSKWGTTNERRIWSRYFCPLKVPSMTYKSILQFREKHYTTKLPGFNGHVTIWDGISGRGRECTGRMKVAFVESSWWPRPRMETEKYNISTGTYCRHNCVSCTMRVMWSSIAIHHNWSTC